MTTSSPSLRNLDRDCTLCLRTAAERRDALLDEAGRQVVRKRAVLRRQPVRHRHCQLVERSARAHPEGGGRGGSGAAVDASSEVVAPSFWRLMFSMEADRLLLDCGMRKEVSLPLTEQGGLLKALDAEVERKEGGDGTNGIIRNGHGHASEEGDEEDEIRCYLVLLLQDTKATMVDLCDWAGF